MPEMELLLNPDWILTKNRILDKMDQLLGGLLEQQQDFLQQHPRLLPDEVLAAGAKLSRGENYQGLPYRILDHPRCFDQAGYLAIRSFCWWGHFFSCTLLLSGQYQQRAAAALQASYEYLLQQDYYYCIHPDPWQHHFDRSNYIPLAALSPAELERENRARPFLKLAKKIPLQEWEQAGEQLQQAFMDLAALAGNRSVAEPVK